MCVDYDPADVWREEWRRARKDHRCGECGRTIEVRERYRVVAGLTDGYWFGAKQCEQCDAAAHWLDVVCSGYLLSDVGDELREHFAYEDYPISTPALGRLCDLMAARWAPDGALLDVDDVRATVTLALIPWRAWERRERERRKAA